MESLLHFLSNYLDFAVRSLAELVDDQMRIKSINVVEEKGDLKTDRAL